MGFENPVSGGLTLLREAIQSLGFVTGVTGWSIFQNGNAEFNNITIRGTFSGTDFEITANGIFFYKGTPTAGNLIASYTNVTSTDQYGNFYLYGNTTYGTEAGYYFADNFNSISGFSFWTSTSYAGPYTQQAGMFATNAGALNISALNGIYLTAGSPLQTGPTFFVTASGGYPTFEDASGNYWSCGRATVYLTAAQSISSTSLTAIPGLSLGVTPGIYRMKLKLVGTNSAVSGVTCKPGFIGSNGLVTSGNALNEIFSVLTSTGAVAATAAFSVNVLSNFSASPASTGTSFSSWCDIDGILSVTQAGTISAAGLTSTNGDSFHLAAGSYMQLEATNNL